MKKLLLTIGLTVAGSLAYGQGTVSFSNTTLSKTSTASTADGVTPVGTAATPTTPGIEYGLFYGIGESTSLTLLTSIFGVNSTSTSGVIANSSDGKSAMNVTGIPGTVA